MGSGEAAPAAAHCTREACWARPASVCCQLAPGFGRAARAVHAAARQPHARCSRRAVSCTVLSSCCRLGQGRRACAPHSATNSTPTLPHVPRPCSCRRACLPRRRVQLGRGRGVQAHHARRGQGAAPLHQRHGALRLPPQVPGAVHPVTTGSGTSGDERLQRRCGSGSSGDDSPCRRRRRKAQQGACTASRRPVSCEQCAAARTCPLPPLACNNSTCTDVACFVACWNVSRACQRLGADGAALHGGSPAACGVPCKAIAAFLQDTCRRRRYARANTP